MGHILFLLFYLFGGVVATYAHVATDPSSTVPLIGASGAIAAVLGAYIVLWPHARILTAVIFYFITVVQLPAIVVLGFWFVLQTFQGAVTLGAETPGGVAWFAHIGGFVFGAAVAWLFLRGRADREALRALVHATATGATPAPVTTLHLDDIDTTGALRRALTPEPGQVWLVRPDAHVAAVVPGTDPEAVRAAVRTALGHPAADTVPV
jgi:hypothetical protein